MKPRPVAITWADHYHVSPGKWVDLDEVDVTDLTPCAVMSVGILIGQTSDTYVIAQSVTEANDATGVFVILRSCVKKVKKL